jgi:Spy/CpxP family protein refolding chaperone
MAAASKELHAELITGIKAGKLDAAKLEQRYAAMDKLSAAAHDKELAALDALYAALDPAQRKAAVASARATQVARDAKWARRMHKGALVGPDAGVVDAGGHGGGLGGPGRSARRAMDHLTRGIVLDEEQQKKVDALTAKEDAVQADPDREDMKKRVEALLVAFEKDGFEAKKVDPFDGKKARGPMDQETKLFTQLLPILKPAQREQLAAKMEKMGKGASPHGRRGMGGGGRLESGDD